jgi:integrase
MKYLWQNDPAATMPTTLEIAKPLVPENLLVDLCNGQKYKVLSVKVTTKAGIGEVETARKKWSEALADLFRDAGVKEGHAHRLRDTFAVELLKAGTPIERVSILLGHASTKITEKHYNPWNRARQEQAEADVARSWASDPVIILETTKGTREVHGEPWKN